MCDPSSTDGHKINWGAQGGDTGDYLGDGTALDETDMLIQVRKLLVQLHNDGELCPNDCASVVIRKEQKGVVTRTLYAVRFELEAVGAGMSPVSTEQGDEDDESTEGG